MSKPQLHPSAINMGLRCGVQYEYRYVKGEKIPPPFAIHRGLAVHKTVKRDLDAKMTSGELLSNQQVADLAHSHFRRSVSDEGVWMNDDEKGRGEAIVRGEAADQTIRLSLLHHKEFAPTLKPTHIERPFVLDVRGYDFQVAGQIDQEYVDSIHDVKTKKASPTKDEAQQSIQLPLYGLGFWAANKRVPAGARLDCLVDTKTPKTATASVAWKSLADFQPVLNVVQRFWEGVTRGVFYPAARVKGAWWCDRRRCGYWSKCPFVNNPVMAKPLSLESQLKASIEATKK